MVTNKEENYNVRRWGYVVLSVLLMMMYGTVYSWSVFRGPVEIYYGIGATLSGLPYMFFLLTYALSMMLGGILIEKISPRMLLIGGGVFITVGWLLSAVSSGIAMLTVAYGVLIGFGVGISYGVPISVITQWFPKKRGIVVGIILAGFGLSPLITAPVGYWMIESFGLVQTFVNYGILFGIFIPCLSFAIRGPRQVVEELEGEGASVASQPLELLQKKASESRAMVKQKSFGIVYGCFFLGTMIGLTIIGLTNNVGVRVAGLSPDLVAWWMSIFALFNGLGRPIFGWMTERYRPSVAMSLSFSLIFLASLAMIVAGEGKGWIYIFSFSILWLNLGAWLAIAPITTLSLYGMENYSKNYGVVFTAYGLGAVVGVMSSGVLIDVFNDYTVLFLFVALLSLIGLGLSRRLDKAC